MVTPFLLVYLVLSWARAQDPFSDQPKLFSENGNLKLQAGRDRNITLLTSGSGQVYLNSENLVQLSGLARTASDQVNSFKWTVLPPIQQKLYRLVRAVEGRDGLIRKMQQLESGNASISAPRGGSSSTLSDLNIKVKRIDRQLKKVTANLRKNECLGNPCRNGGTCIDLYNRFLCLCPAGWEGPACDTDVNECAKFKSTEDGCHNGGTCVNIPGGFQCICPPHYYGVHCNAKNFTCNGVSDAELCGHGSCREQGGSYVCVCDEGWSNGPGGVCNKDINECNTKTPVCSVSPPVQCINTPGSFQCAPCPTGYTGNGLYCVDVDECLVNNGGCSMTPYVECINTQGYRKCGQCPHGWVGDGTTCRQGTTGCSVQNGGCHPLATCRETSDTVRSVISCTCPPGMGGSGVGLMGCAYGMSGNPCGGVTCEHGGICAPIGDRGYRCQCEPGFTGKNCEVRMNLSCLNNPCENGGTCTTTSQLEVRCLCPDGYSGPYCADQMMACGGTIVRSNGTLHNSLNGYNTRSVHSCIWTLDSGVVDRVLTISFSKFTVYSKRGDCIDNYLELRDAEFPTDASSHLGRFCSPHALPPSNVTSYSSKVIVTYMSSVKNNEIFDEWQLQWTSSKSDCVFSLHNITSPGSISTPGYPRYYTKMHTCMWSLSASPGYRLELTISDVELGSNNADDCLKINDGEMVYSPVLLKVCQSGRNLSPVTTSGSEALVWPSDLPDVKGNTRLQITYRPVPGVPGCGGTFTFPEGDISSSQLQDSNQDLLCEWTIHLTAEERIKLYFNKVQIGSRSCDSYLEVYNGHSTSLMSKFCDGASSLAPLTSSGNTVRLVYKTKYVWGATKPSFSIHYETVCGGVFTSPRGDLKSPLYPRGYPTSRLCQYTISQPPGKIITLDFQAMGLRAPDKKKACPYESVKVYDGDSKNHSLIGEYCGTNIPTTIVSKYNVLYLEFKTDGVSGEESDRFGFHANYSTLDLGCGGIYTESSGLISFTSRSPPSSCEWILSVPPGNALQLTWISFSVGASDDPETRWFGYSIMASRNMLKQYHENLLNLEVYDNVTRPGRIMDRLHGARTPGPMTSVGNVVTLVLKKPKTSFRSGTPSSASFALSYMAVNLSTTCGGNFYSPEGTLTSPQYPDPYPPNMLCVWTLTVPRGQQIRLNFTTFQLERYFCNPACGDTDYLEVRDGGYESSPQLGIYCCKNHPGEITSSGHQLYIKFFSDDDRFKYPGFKITWDSASTGCGGILTGSSGSIISPGYPYPYAYRTTCYWKIYVSQGSSITLWSLDVQLDCTKLLASDLEVFEGGTSGGPLLGTYCPRRGGPWLMSQPTKWQSVIQSQTNVVLIKYTVNNMEDKGFHLQYKTLCNRTLSGYRGVIESVNYPRAVTPGLECYWNITVPTGNQIRFAFTDLALQPMPRFGPWSTGCSSYVEILQNNQVDAWYNSGSTEMHPLLNKTCRIEKPLGALTTTSNMAVVHFHSAYFASRGKGFRLEWALKGCGGVFDKRPTGTITSPHYGEHMNGKYYQHSLQCDWQIKADLDHSIQITIEDLDLETVGDCSRDYLIIYNGLSDQGVNLTDHLCLGMTKPITVTASNAAFIRFISDSSVAGRGFKLTYKQVPSSCGGLYSGTSGVIHSKNYPKLFDQYDDCLYQITVADGHLVQLTMEDLDLGYYQLWGKNKGNVVYVYDGDSVNGTLLKNYTGNSISPNSSTTISSSNKMLVHFKANAMPHSGFKASYKLACGARIDTDGSGNLVLNVADIIATKGANCTWTIMAKNPESRVSLAVTSTFPNLDMYQIEEPSNKFFVYDGETTRSPNLVQSSVIKIPHSIVSKGPAMHIVLSLDSMDTDYLSQFKWFATYSVRNIACGGELTGCRGTFSSPNYPLQYPLNTECVWTVKSSPGNKMAVQFPVFQLEDSDKCNEDYVEIREADAQGKLLGVYCSSQVPLNVSVDAAFWIKFKSNGVGTATGFTADYYYVEDIEIQGQTGGLITSPQYPTPLSEYKKFSYTIRVSDGAKIRITILESYLSGHSDECEFGGTLKVFEGTEALDSKLLHPNLCTAPLNTQFISLTSEVLVVFESSGLRLGSYFKLKWEAVPAGTTVAGNTTEVNKTSGGLSDFPYLINPRVISYDLTLTNSSVNISHHSLNNSKDTYVFKFTALQGYRLTLVMMNYSNVVSMDPDTAQRYRVKLQVYSGSSDPFRQGDVVKRLEISDNPGSIVDVRNKRTVTSYNNVLYVVIEQETFGSEDTGPTAMKFNATVTLTCGGIITGQLSGRIEMNPSIENVTFFPLNNRFLVPMIPMTCDWVVAVRPRRTLTVKMITADFTPKTKSGDTVECGDNFLQIKNGGSISSPKLGKEDKFCATILAKNSKKQTAMSTSSNLLYVRYETKYNQPKSFALSFEETSVSCGGEVILYERGNTWASLTSPNYPDPPPTHVECTWTIHAPPHKKLQIEFDENFDLKSSAKCETEYVEVNDGSTEVSPSLGKYCIQTPPIMKSTGNSMLVHYFTDADDPKDGFKANVSFQSCGGFTKNILGPYILSADLSQLTEPLCEWTLVTAPTNYFTLNVTTFNANSLGRYFTNCDRFDQLHIYTVDHFDRNRTLVYSECKNKPFYLKTGVSKIIVQYNKTKTIDVSHHWSIPRDNSRSIGFSLTVNASPSGCGGTLTSGSGTIALPHVPDVFRFCVWHVNVPSGRRVRFRPVNVEFGESYTVPDDLAPFYMPNNVIGFFYYDIFDFRYRAPFTLITKPSSVRRTIDATGNKVIVIARLKSGNGFQLDYSSDLPALCGGVLEDKGTLRSPDNQTSFSCLWSKTISPHQTFALVISGIVNKHDSNARCNSTSALSSNTFIVYNEQEQFIHQLCSSYEKPTMFLSPYPTTNLHVIKGRSIRGRQWEYPPMNFSSTYATYPCGGFYLSATNISLGTGLNGELHCVWLVEYPSGDDINKISFVQQSKCNLSTSDGHDNTLFIYNGPRPTSPLLKKINVCGGGTPPDLTATSNMVWIEYHAGNNLGAAFSLNLEKISLSCGDILTEKTGVIQSPGYADHTYPADTECEWTIQVPEGFYIALQFTDRFFIQDSLNCTSDYLSIYDWRGADDYVLLDRLCGRSVGRQYNSSRHQMKLRFRSDSSVTADGFRVRYQAHCGGIYSLPTLGLSTDNPDYIEGTIMSPNYPNDYPPYLRCNYTFIETTNRTIGLNFTDFKIEDSEACMFDKLYLSAPKQGDSTATTGTEDQTVYYCGDTSPGYQSLFGRGISVLFMSDPYVSNRGFRFHYKISKCGGTITEDKSFSVGVSSRMKCVWNISAPPKKEAYLIVQRSTSAFSTQSESDSLWSTCQAELKFHNNNKDQMFYKTCISRKTHLEKFKSLGRYSKLTLTTRMSSQSGPDDRIDITVKFTYDAQSGCGGDKVIPAGGRTSINPLTSATDPYFCEWSLSTPTPYKLQISFTSINIYAETCEKLMAEEGASSKCRCNILQVDNDSPVCLSNQTAGLQYEIPTDVTLKYTQNAYFSGLSFDVLVESILTECGVSELVATKERKVFISPPYKPNLNCAWSVESDIGGNVEIKFLDMDIEQIDSTCKTSYVQLKSYSVYRGENQILHTYCGSTLPPISYFPDSDVNHMEDKLISYRTGNSPKHRRGFKFEYSVVGCNREYTGNHGNLALLKQSGGDCIVHISAENKTSTLDIIFLQFKLATQNCDTDKLVLKDASNRILATLCGSALPLPLFTATSKLTAHLLTSGNQTAVVSFTYVTSQCGVVLRDLQGALASRDYPQAYRQPNTCVYTITPPFPITVTFRSFNLGSAARCAANYLTLDSDRKEAVKYCGSEVPAPLRVEVSLTLTYTTSADNEGTGWYLTYKPARNSILIH